MRVGVYADALYRRQGEVVSTASTYMGYLAELRHHAEELTFFGRVHPEPAQAAVVVPAGVRFVPLAWYPSLWRPLSLGRALARTRQTVGAQLGSLDALVVFGPHPLGQMVARQAARRGKAVVLGVRQDFVPYVALRAPGPLGPLARGAARLLAADFDRLSRQAGVVAVSELLAARFRGRSPAVVVAYPSLVRAGDLAPIEVVRERPWPGPREILAVGRLAPEKNPLVLADVLAGVREELGGSWTLTVAGEGPLREALVARATALGVAEHMTLLGHVPYGEALWALYRRASVLVHTSHTEGAPQVLFEAGAAGLPVVATDVGAVSELLEGGRAGTLVPPGDPGAVVAALCALGRDGRATEKAAVLHEKVAGHTLEAEVAKLAALVERASG